MARLSRTAFALLEQLEDEEDVDNVDELPTLPPEPEEPEGPRMPQRAPRPPPPRPRQPPNVGDKLRPEDFKYTRMCEILLTAGACESPTCTFAHTTQELKAAKLRLGRRIAEEQAKLGWVPLPPEPRPQLPAHEAAGPSSGSGGGAAQLSAKYQAAGKYKKVLCWHYTRNNGFCSFGDRCTFAHGELELRQFVHDEALVQAEMRDKGLRPQLAPETPPLAQAAEPEHAQQWQQQWEAQAQQSQAQAQAQQQQRAAQPPSFQGAFAALSVRSPPPPRAPAACPPRRPQYRPAMGPPRPAPPAAGRAAAGSSAVPMGSAAQAQYLASVARLQDDDAPDAFICPILHVLLEDPVVAADGHTYERHAIQTWLSNNSTSPMTGEELGDTRLLPNHALRAAISAVISKS